MREHDLTRDDLAYRKWVDKKPDSFPVLSQTGSLPSSSNKNNESGYARLKGSEVSKAKEEIVLDSKTGIKSGFSTNNATIISKSMSSDSQQQLKNPVAAPRKTQAQIHPPSSHETRPDPVCFGQNRKSRVDDIRLLTGKPPRPPPKGRPGDKLVVRPLSR